MISVSMFHMKQETVKPKEADIHFRDILLHVVINYVMIEKEKNESHYNQQEIVDEIVRVLDNMSVYESKLILGLASIEIEKKSAVASS